MSVAGPRLDIFVRDEYVEGLLGRYTLDEETIELNFSGPKRNIDDDLNELESGIGHSLSGIVRDLYRIALVVHTADLSIKRNPRIGYRTIRILMSVSDKSRWDSAKDQLESLLRFLSNGDIFSFHFAQSKLEQPFEFKVGAERVISLLSGGLDSLAGAKWLLDSGLEPILISHCSQNQICNVQVLLAEAVRKLSGRQVSHYRISAGKMFQQKEYSQFTRSFLYVTLGAVFALEIGINRMFIFENGVIALNIPISVGRVAGNTRTTHPAFLMDYQRLMAKVFSAKLDISNPFLELTKGEVVKLLDSNGYREIVKNSVSCTERGAMRYAGIQTSVFTHCGRCLPCILRRASTNHAGLWNYDANYSSNVCDEYDKVPVDTVKIIAQTLDFGRSLEKCPTDDDALREFPDFLAYEGFNCSPAIATYRRHTTQIKEFLQARASQSLKAKLVGI